MLIATGTKGSTGPRRPSTIAMFVSSESKIWSISGSQGCGLLAKAKSMCSISMVSRLLVGRLFFTWLKH